MDKIKYIAAIYQEANVFVPTNIRYFRPLIKKFVGII